MSTKKMQIIGLKGKSAYQYAQDGGYTGTEAEFKEKMAKELDTVYDYNNLNEAILATAIKPEASGEFIHITDSAALPIMNFGMEGKTEQKTTEGRNWISERFSDYESGSYSATDGTKTDNSNAVRLKELTPVSDSNIYTYVETPVEGIKIIARGYDENQEFLHNLGELVTGSTKYIQADTKYIGITLFNDNTTMVLSDWQSAFENGLKLYISSSTKTTYEPYTNGPSPNPDYPQEIVNAGVYNEETGRYEIGCSVWNRNWYTGGDVEFTGSNKSIKLNRPLPIGTYYMSALVSSTDIDDTRCLIVPQGCTGSGTYLTRNASQRTSSYFILTSECTRITFYPSNNNGNSAGDSATFKDIQIELLEATDYTPHQSQQFTLTSPVPLTKWDKLVKRDGVYGWSIWSNSVEELILTRNNVSSALNTMARFYIPTITGPQYGYGICNRLMFNQYGAYENGNGSCQCGFFHNNQLCIALSYDLLGITYGTVTSEDAVIALETYMADKPLTVIYQTAEEQSFHPLPDSEQALLKQFETYYQVTNIYNDQNCPMSIQYIADTQTYIDNLTTSLTNAVVSLGGEV